MASKNARVETPSEIKLTTDRLRLRPPAVADLDFFNDLYGDSDVMKYIPPNGKPSSPVEAGERLERLLDHWRKHGYGMFLIEIKNDGLPAGYCGLRYMEGIDKVELGYIISRQYWGEGVASEAASACIQYARNILKTDELISVTSPENMASQKILTRLGFKRTPDLDGIYHGMEHIFFIYKAEKVIRSLT